MTLRVLKSKDDLQELLDLLEASPNDHKKLHTLGILRNTIRGKISYESIVDNWPDFSVIVTRRVDDASENKYYKHYSHFIYAKELDNVVNFLRSPCVIQWDEVCYFSDVSMEICSIVMQLCREKGCEFSLDKEHFVNLFQTPVQDPTLPQGYYFGSLRPEHAVLINEQWDYGGSKDKEDMLRWNLENFPSYCIYNDNDEAISWITSRPHGSSGVSVTLPEYRNRGLATAVWKHWIVSAQKSGELPFVMIHANNHASNRVADKLSVTRFTDGLFSIKSEPENKDG